MTGVEPVTSRLRIVCSGQLSYISTFAMPLYISKRIERFNPNPNA